MGYVGLQPASKALTAADITDGIIANADIASDAAIAISKLATITLATNTSGDYVQNITAGTGLTSTGATSGENIAHSLSVDAAQTGITSAYNTSLKVGRDSQNLIDFATTDNKIILRVNNVDEVELVENALSPVTASGVDLGTTSLEWGNIYIGDDKKVFFGDGQDASIEYDEDGTDQLRISGNTVFANQVESTLDIMIDSTPADETVSGVTATFTAGEALSRGEVVYYKQADSRMWKAVATAAATSRCVAMAAADIGSGSAGLFLLQGFCTDNGTFPDYSASSGVGKAVYTPEAETSGENVPEATAPDTDGDFVQIIGYVVAANTLYFNPSNDIIEHA